jgi:hypothetical protein
MRLIYIYGGLLFLLLINIPSCSKPESKLVGTWINEKTSSSIEFNKDKTGVIFQRTNPHLPPNIPFRWEMLKDGEFKVETGAPDHPEGPSAKVTLVGKDTIVIDNDTFKKVK